MAEPTRGLASLIYSPDPMVRLYALSTIRDTQLPRNSPLHDVYGPMEHGAYTQAVMEDKPWLAPLMALAIPAYTGTKALGMTNARSSPSWAEMGAGYKGMMKGLFPSFWPRRPQLGTVDYRDVK